MPPAEGTAEAARAVEATRITRALSSAPATNGSSQDTRASAAANTQAPSNQAPTTQRPPVGPQLPQQPTTQQQSQSAAQWAAAGQQQADPEATAQHMPVAPATPSAGDSAERTELTTVVAPADHETENDDPSYDDFDDFEDFDEEAGAGELNPDEDPNEISAERDVQEIDATLARFSAVHDEIAREEEQRRHKLGWLRGNRAEPELGKDMPFDFVEGREGTSRVEWKKQQRKKRTNVMVLSATVTASILVFIVLGVVIIA